MCSIISHWHQGAQWQPCCCCVAYCTNKTTHLISSIAASICKNSKVCTSLHLTKSNWASDIGKSHQEGYSQYDPQKPVVGQRLQQKDSNEHSTAEQTQEQDITNSIPCLEIRPGWDTHHAFSFSYPAYFLLWVQVCFSCNDAHDVQRCKPYRWDWALWDPL